MLEQLPLGHAGCDEVGRGPLVGDVVEVKCLTRSRWHAALVYAAGGAGITVSYDVSNRTYYCLPEEWRVA